MCQHEGCSRIAQHKRTYCFRHAMERRSKGEDVEVYGDSKVPALSPTTTTSDKRVPEIKADNNCEPNPQFAFPASLADYEFQPLHDFGPAVPLQMPTEYQIPPPLTSVYTQIKHTGTLVPPHPDQLEYTGLSMTAQMGAKLPDPHQPLWDPYTGFFDSI